VIQFVLETASGSVALKLPKPEAPVMTRAEPIQRCPSP
jgi:hypothetical protein